MNEYLKNRELEELGDGIVRRFLSSSGGTGAERCIDIDGLARSLGLNVVYHPFAEEDPDKVGFLADGYTTLMIRKDGRADPFLFPLGTVVVDSYLLREEESGRRRFTIAHEVAPHVMNRHRPMPQFHRFFDPERAYTAEELGRQLNWVENRADRLAAVILMPGFTVSLALNDFNRGERVRIYGENVLADRERKVIHKMAAQVGASFTAMMIRLRELDLLEYRPLIEYLDKAIPGGEK